MHGIPRAEENIQEKLKLSGALESEQFVELFGKREKQEAVESDWAICCCGTESSESTLDSHLPHKDKWCQMFSPMAWSYWCDDTVCMFVG